MSCTWWDSWTLATRATTFRIATGAAQSTTNAVSPGLMWFMTALLLAEWPLMTLFVRDTSANPRIGHIG